MILLGREDLDTVKVDELEKRRVERSTSTSYQANVKLGHAYDQDRDLTTADLLTSRHREIVRLSCAGFTPREIANFLGVGRDLVSSTLNNNLVKHHAKQINSRKDQLFLEAQSEIFALLPQAVEVYEEILTNEDTPLNLKGKYATEVFDRTGLSKIQRVESKSISYQLTHEDVEEIKKRASGEPTDERMYLDDGLD